MVNVLRKTMSLGMLILGLTALSRPLSAQEEIDALRKSTKRVAAIYPALARQAHLSGTVKIVVVVTPEGNVKAVRTVGGNPVLVPAAEDAARQWKFEASKKESHVLVAIQFGA